MATKRSLHTAKDSQHVLKLLRSEADPDAADDKGDTPLHAYVKRKDKHKFDCLMTLLIHSKCDLDKPDDEGMTPLHVAAQLNDVKSAKALIAFGAAFDALNPLNRTPLDIAHELHHFDSEMVRILSGVGAKFGEAMVQTLYALPTLSVWNKALKDEAENGKNMTDYGTGKNNSVSEKSDERSMEEVARKLENVHVAPQESHRVRAVRFQTPDASIEQGLTLTQVSILLASGKYERSPEDSLSAWELVDSPPPSFESVEADNERETSGETPGKTSGGLSDTAVAGIPMMQAGTQPMEKKHPIRDYTDGPMLCKLEQNTQAALDRGLSASTGDEGYAAWVQYREIQKAKKKAGKSSVGPSMIGVGHSGIPLPFKVKGGQRILCLDGGGIRGLVQIEILRQIEEATGKRITELFDWIVGTSTGGILALAMVYAGLDLDDLQQMYFEMKETVFKNPKFGYACDTPALEALLKKTLGTDVRMCDKREPRVMVTAVDKRDTALHLRFFNNCYNDEYSQVPVWKAARYTSAAPIFFTECDNYVDGGILANNPCDYALTEIQDHLDTHARGSQIACVVSVGCGVYPPEKIGNTDVLAIGKNIFKLSNFPKRLSNMLQLLTTALTKSEDVARNCRSRCERQNIPYYRFSPELDEIISTIEDDNEKLCDIILKAKMLLEGSQAQVDTLIQHFYYTSAHENGLH